MDLAQELSKAIDFEQKGHDIYTNASKSTKNELVKKTFGYLAEQEIFHKKAIESYAKKNIADIKLAGDSSKKTEEFFNMTIKEFSKKSTLSKDDIIAHETALHLEKSSYDYYKDLYTKSKELAAKNFFKFLMEQEEAHYELIEKAYYYISDPIGYEAHEERWFPEGG
ncbi:MAG: ferritin family protein [archaeon]